MQLRWRLVHERSTIATARKAAGNGEVVFPPHLTLLVCHPADASSSNKRAEEVFLMLDPEPFVAQKQHIHQPGGRRAHCQHSGGNSRSIISTSNFFVSLFSHILLHFTLLLKQLKPSPFGIKYLIIVPAGVSFSETVNSEM